MQQRVEGPFYFIHALRAVAVLMAVLFDAAIALGMSEWGPHHLLVHPLHAIALPLLFACDGFLLAAGHRRPFDYRRYLALSARHLLLPWLALSLLYALIRLLMERAGVLDHAVMSDLAPAQWLGFLYTSEAAPQLVLLPALLLIRLVAPVALELQRRAPGWSAAALLLAVAGFVFGRGPARELVPFGAKDPLMYALWGLPFFFAGVLTARCRQLLDRYWPVMALVLGSVYLAGQVPGWMVFPGMGYQYVQLFATIAVFYGLFNRPGLAARVGGYAVAIYVLCEPVLLKAVLLGLSRLISNLVELWLTAGLLTFALGGGAVYLLLKVGRLRPFLGPHVEPPTPAMRANVTEARPAA